MGKYDQYKESAFTHEEMQPMIIETDMTDIVERLLREVPHCEDPSNYGESDLLILNAADEIERLREALQHAYDDCLDAVNKIKTDPFTELGANHKSRLGDISAKDWMVAFAEDVEREIKARAALGEKE